MHFVSPFFVKQSEKSVHFIIHFVCLSQMFLDAVAVDAVNYHHFVARSVLRVSVFVSPPKGGNVHRAWKKNCCKWLLIRVCVCSFVCVFFARCLPVYIPNVSIGAPKRSFLIKIMPAPFGFNIWRHLKSKLKRHTQIGRSSIATGFYIQWTKENAIIITTVAVKNTNKNERRLFSIKIMSFVYLCQFNVWSRK